MGELIHASASLHMNSLKANREQMHEAELKSSAEARGQRCYVTGLLRDGLVAVGILVTHLSIGITFYCLVEEKPCEDGSRHGLPPEDCTERWTVIDALYFSMATMSTCGYGDFSPSSSGSRAFTSIFLIVGITLVFGKVAGVGARLASNMDRLMRGLVWKAVLVLETRSYAVRCVSGVFKDKFVDLDGDSSADYVEVPPASVYYTREVSVWLLYLTVLQVGSASVFVALLDDMSFATAMWHCWVTATTVGYGDVPIYTQEARGFAAFHIFVSVIFLAAFVNHIGNAKDTRAHLLRKQEQLRRQLDKELMLSLDKDGDGVDKAEFLVGMLTKLGICNAEDTEPFIAMFDALDQDGSGRLTSEDIEKLWRMKTEKFEEQERIARSRRSSGATPDTPGRARVQPSA